MPWHLDDLGIPALRAQSSGEGIRVAVLDTGVAAVPGAFGSLRAFAPDGSAAGNIDDDGHGTACASLIASQTTDAPGVAPAVELVSIKITAGGKPVEADVLAAFETVVAKKCHVVSCSFTLRQADTALLDAIRAACNQGIVVVAASGNDPSVASDFPERTPNVLVVGPYGRNRQFLPSRFGLFTDVLAPGEDLDTLTPAGATVSFGETSGAAAVTAGVMALVLSITRSSGTARVGLALEGLARATALPAAGARLLDPDRLLHAAQNLP